MARPVLGGKLWRSQHSAAFSSAAAARNFIIQIKILVLILLHQQRCHFDGGASQPQLL